jgi:tRNA 2-thiouridine synthesizing protein A
MSTTEFQVTETLDATGLLCPMPVVKTAKAMKALEPGQVLEVLASDRGAIKDIPAWAGQTGNELLEWHEDGETLVFHIRKGA